jgi:hypothetical protein
MVAQNNSRRLSYVSLDIKPATDRLVQQIETYFVAHPELSWENFLLSALQRELVFRNWNENSGNRPSARIRRSESSEPTSSRTSLTESSVRFHALLAARVVALHRPKHGLWPIISEFLLRNPFCRFVQSYRRMK